MLEFAAKIITFKSLKKQKNYQWKKRTEKNIFEELTICNHVYIISETV